MSQENVEIVTRYFIAATRRLAAYWKNPRSIAETLRTEDLDADSEELLSHLHPDVRWTNALGIVFEGQAECARGVDELLQASQAYTVTLREVADLGGDHVLAKVAVWMRGESSGAPGRGSIFTLLTLRDGRIARSEEYLSRADALNTIGLTE
jgi:ketosteroid isomerase-like protein